MYKHHRNAYFQTLVPLNSEWILRHVAYRLEHSNQLGYMFGAHLLACILVIFGGVDQM